MKQFIMAMVAICTIVSCTKKEKEVEATDPPPASVFKQVDVLQQPLQVPNTNVVLPKGTKVFIDQAESEIRVELPAGYAFFTGSKPSPGNASLKTLPVIVIGSYTCKCGGQDGRCNVFYLSVGGFGCLHNSCTATCSGYFVTIDDKEIEGVLNLENSKISAALRTTTQSASLSPSGKQAFFDNPLVQQEILAKHQALFNGFPVPDLSKQSSRSSLQKDYVYIKTYLYGVRFYMLAPRVALVNHPEIEQISIEANTCTCSNKGECRIEKKSLLGIITVHWCEGDCDACVMAV
ncbi:MAG: hypothetical protein J0I84_17935 [Terrimonas sp.]|nr:hypothetical protein [Terrimonas sp.]